MHRQTIRAESHALEPPLWTMGDTARWGSAGLIVLVDAVWLGATGRSIAPGDLQQRVTLIVWLGCAAAALVLMLQGPLAKRGPAYRTLAQRLRAGQLAILTQALAWLVVFTGSVSVLSYLLVSIGPPLIDAKLAAADAALGLDWPSLYQWVKAHPQIDSMLRWAYMSGQSQLLLIAVLIGVAGPIRLLRELLSNLLVASALLSLVAACFPAAGAFHHYAASSAINHADLASFSHFFPLRDGSLKVFALSGMQGLVSMPSFHTTAALFYIQATHWSRWVLVVSVPLNILMICSTPTVGGHYFVDLLGGVALWVLTTLMLRWMSGARRRGTRPHRLPRSTASQPV